MSISSPLNSIWPSNGIIGSEQIQIPDGINTKWPEGDAIVGNFVFKNGKLAGFVDTKSLVINDSKSTTIPYDYAEMELPLILKDTMTITGGERSKNLIINCMEDAAVYITPMLKEILGDAKFITEFIKEENKLVIHTDRLDDETLVTVGELLERVLPQNVEVERYNQSIDISWKDWTTGYTQVEWLQGDGNSYIDTQIFVPNISEIITTYERTSNSDQRHLIYIQYGDFRVNPTYWSSDLRVTSPRNAGTTIFFFHGRQAEPEPIPLFTKSTLRLTDGDFFQDGEKIQTSENVNMPPKDVPPASILLFAYNEFFINYGGIYTGNNIKPSDGFRCYELKTIGIQKTHFVPCIDPTGAPCMYDTVSRTAFYNKGTGDFLYPTDAAPASAIGMDDKFYAKLTEHGVRRLYKVPDGCNMTKYEYAVANGFKEIVEPPKPKEGYWTSEWTETDTQIVLNWVEIESSEQKIES